MESDDKLVYTVPEAGERAGLGKNASYAAARRGEIPTLRLGGLLRVPKKKWDRILAGEAE
jgi:excisionase family DNA binding protein